MRQKIFAIWQPWKRAQNLTSGAAARAEFSIARPMETLRSPCPLVPLHPDTAPGVAGRFLFARA
jgi:hypothetical protein